MDITVIEEINVCAAVHAPEEFFTVIVPPATPSDTNIKSPLANTIVETATFVGSTNNDPPPTPLAAIIGIPPKADCTYPSSLTPYSEGVIPVAAKLEQCKAIA